jgi:glycosyltransferase involved in cell wall biosynthesis
MNVALVVPSRSDPAHRRVVSSLRRCLVEAGDRVRVFPPRGGPSRRKLEGALQGVQVCHVQFFSRGLDWLGRVNFPREVKLVLTHQGASFELMERRDVFARLARRADAVTTVSRRGLAELLARYPALKPKASWVPNGANAPAGGRKTTARARPFVLAASRLAAYKGIDLLLMAFAGLAARRDDLDLVLCGPDQTNGRLARFALKLGLKGRVRFLGDTRPAALERLLERSLFFVLPSRSENLPMSLLEALAAGKAVVAADAGGVRELVRDGENGILIQPNDAAALERALDRLAGDATLRRRLGRRAARGAKHFTWSSATERYRELYAAIERRNSRPSAETVSPSPCAKASSRAAARSSLRASRKPPAKRRS